MKRLISSIAIILLALTPVAAQKWQKPLKPFTINELLQVRRVSDPQLSPDGRWIAYTISDTDKAANRRTTQIYLISSEGGDPRQLTSEKQSSTSPRWSPDGKRLAFVSASQIWTIEVTQTGASSPTTSAPKQITNISTGADGPVWSP
ncbi:MAG TPA: hypothetical protein VFO63_16340, partial [Blastocatellia bacterium]|nr:hypothetical protein [Blastocatellia bacterium]